MKYSNEDRRRIMNETLDTLQRGQEEHEQPPPPEQDDPLAEALRRPVEDEGLRWRREQEEAEQRRAKAKREREARTLEARLAAKAERDIATLRAEMLAQIEGLRAFVLEVVGESLGRFANGIIKQVENAFLRMEKKIDAVRSRSASDDGIDKPVTLPNPLRRVN
jgi:hypothetical protein